MLDTTIWVAQGFLALFFFAAGLPKVAGRGLERWVGFDDLPRPLTIVIGVCEVLGAIALVVPLLVDRYEWTTPLAAIGIAAISLMASGFHIRVGEGLPAVETALWASLAGAIAVARWKETATGPSLPEELLIPVLIALVLAIVLNLVVLACRPAEPRIQEHEQVPTAGSGKHRTLSE